MKYINALLLAVTSIFLTSCANVETSEGGQLYRLLVSQSVDTIAVIDLNRRPSYQFYPLEQSRSTANHDFYSQLHPFGNTAIVVGSRGQTRIVNLANGTSREAQSQDLIREPFVALKNGSGSLAIGSDYRSVRFVNAFLGRSNQSLTVPGRSIIDIAVCDDSQTALALVREDFAGTSTRVQRISISSGGQLSAGTSLNTNGSAKQIECAPGSQYAAYISSGVANGLGTQWVNTLNLANGGLSNVDRNNAYVRGPVDLSLVGADRGKAVNLAFSPDGNSLYVRLLTVVQNPRQGWLERFSVNAGSLSTTTWKAQAPTHVGGNLSNFESYRITQHPDGSLLYFPAARLCVDEPDHMGGTNNVCRPGVVAVRTSDGQSSHSYFHESLTSPQFISIAPVQCLDLEGNGC